MTQGTEGAAWLTNPFEIKDHKDLTAWKVALELCLAVHASTGGFPTDERFGLVAELRKTARSVICNIAEGHQRRSRREFIRFLDIAQGSRAELETQLTLASHLGYVAEDASGRLMALSFRVGKLLSALSRTLRDRE
jgi:four helix bundle protein